MILSLYGLLAYVSLLWIGDVLLRTRLQSRRSLSSRFVSSCLVLSA
jgi:hypothetical protein